MSNSTDKQIRRSRLNIFLSDFREARRFANYIVNRDLDKSKDAQSKTHLIHLAFNTSLIVSYSRPFHKSNDRNGEPGVSLDKTHMSTVLDGHEQILHSDIIRKRDEAFAHSDSVSHEFEGGDYSGRRAMFYKPARAPLTKEETQALKRMIKKWIEYLEKLREGKSKDD